MAAAGSGGPGVTSGAGVSRAGRGGITLSATAQQATRSPATPSQARRVAQLDRVARLNTAPDILHFGPRTLPAQLRRTDNFGTFQVRPFGSAGPAAEVRQFRRLGGGRAVDDGGKIFEEQRRRIELRRKEVDEELGLAHAAQFVFDVGDTRDQLVRTLGRPPAAFELAKAMNVAGHTLTPSTMLLREKEGMRAINQLFLANHRIVNMIVRKYVFATNLDESDLVQEGNIGLLNAMRLFDPSRAVRFSTFASWHVRGTILRAIMNAHHTIRLPVRVQQEISAIQKEYEQLQIDEEEAAHLLPRLDPDAPQDASIKESSPDRMLTVVAERLGWKKEKVLTRMHAYSTAQALSLDAPASSGDRGGDSSGSATLMGDLISCPKSAVGRLHSDVEEVLLRDELRTVLDTLSNGHFNGARNSVIMRLHYGLEDGVEYTCAQIADMFKMSVSRVYSVVQHELCMLRRLYQSGKYDRPSVFDD